MRTKQKSESTGLFLPLRPGLRRGDRVATRPEQYRGHPEERGEGGAGNRTEEGGKEEEVEEDEAAAAAASSSSSSSSSPQCRGGTMWSRPGTSSGSRHLEEPAAGRHGSRSPIRWEWCSTRPGRWTRISGSPVGSRTQPRALSAGVLEWSGRPPARTILATGA